MSNQSRLLIFIDIWVNFYVIAKFLPFFCWFCKSLISIVS